MAGQESTDVGASKPNNVLISIRLINLHEYNTPVVHILTLSFSSDLQALARRVRLLSYTLISTNAPGVAVTLREMVSPGSAKDWLK